MNEKERSRRIRAAADEEEEEYEEREREKEERPRRRKVNLSKEDPGRSKVKDDGASMEKMMENQLINDGHVQDIWYFPDPCYFPVRVMIHSKL